MLVILVNLASVEGAEETFKCPSGKTDKEISAGCQAETDAMMLEYTKEMLAYQSAVLAGDSAAPLPDIMTDMTAFAAEQSAPTCNKNDCSDFDCYNDGVKSKVFKDLISCSAKGCGCAGSIAKFGFALLIAMIAHWFK